MSLEWPRTPRETLLAFDPKTKRCTMNCSQHLADPRSRSEMMFQCDDCVEVTGHELAMAICRRLIEYYYLSIEHEGSPPEELIVTRRELDRLKMNAPGLFRLQASHNEPYDMFMGCKLKVVK